MLLNAKVKRFVFYVSMFTVLFSRSRNFSTIIANFSWKTAVFENFENFNELTVPHSQTRRVTELISEDAKIVQTSSIRVGLLS